ncbi:UNVERIFIED_CONTAM: hypothetical protein FKN15_016250 [Acipenser sinensis]
MSAEAPIENMMEKPGLGEVNGKPNHEASRKERPLKRAGVSRFEPYGGNPSNRRFRVFVSNIPFDVKWQALKDLMKEKEFRTEELMKKAVEKVNKHNLNGRPLKVKEDLDGEFARRAVQRAPGGPPGGMGMGMGPGPGPGGPPMVNIPPSLMNNPNIPSELLHGLQAGRIGSTIFVANLDYKVGWKKLKEVFGMAGIVVRADILEDKDGKSRGMGTVTFEMPIEAVQAILGCLAVQNIVCLIEHQLPACLSLLNTVCLCLQGVETVKKEIDVLGQTGSYRPPSRLRKRTDFSGKSGAAEDKVFEPNEEAMGVVLHKDSKWYQQWKDFKDNNVVFNRFFEMKMKYDESDNAFIRASRAVTDKVTDVIGGLFSKTEMSEVLTEILKVDPTFDKDAFLKQCEQDIIPNILEAMIRGELDVLKDWCYEATYSQLSHPIQQARAMGLMFHSKVLDIDNIDEKVLRMMYVWALCRDQDELNPSAAWRLLDISASSQEQVL